METPRKRRYSWMDCPSRRHSIHGPDEVWRIFYKSGGSPPKPKRNYVPVEKLLADEEWEQIKQENAESRMHRNLDLTANIWKKVKEDILHMQTRLLGTQNPRYCTRPPIVFKALRLFELKTDNAGALTYMLLDPPVIQFLGYEPGGKYFAQLELLNMSPWSQRLRVIKPRTTSYMMESDEFPFQGKTLGPGTTSHLTVIFVPTGVAILEDSIIVTTEMDRLCIRLIAQQPLPAVFSIPKTVDLGHCLVGHFTSACFAITSMGAGADFRLLVDCQSPSPSDHRFPGVELIYVCHNILFVPPFVVYPCALELQAEETGNVIVLFRPSIFGKFSATVKLVTATDLEWQTTISGTAVDIAVNFRCIDGRPFRPGELDLGLWIGQIAVSSSIQRDLTICNNSPVSYRYFWKLLRKRPELDECNAATDIMHGAYAKEAFSMHPPSGVFEAGSELRTCIKFAPADLLVYAYHATLYLDTRHCPSQHLESLWREFVEMLDMVESRLRHTAGQSIKYQEPEIATTYSSRIKLSAMESKGGIFKVLEVDLMGSGSPFDVQILPPLLCSSGLLRQGKHYQHQLLIRNNGLSTILFAWEQDTTPMNTNLVSVAPIKGEVEAMSTAPVCVTIRARRIGRLQQDVYCRLEDLKGISFVLSLKIDGFVEGPVVTIDEPVLDFGIVQVKKLRTLEFKLTNHGAVAGAFQICFATPCPPMINKAPLALPGFCNLARLDGLRSTPAEGLDLAEKAPTRGDLLLKVEHALQLRQGAVLPHFDLMGGDPVAIHVLKGCTSMEHPFSPDDNRRPPLTFEPSAGLLPPHTTTTVAAVFNPIVCGNFYSTVTCIIEGGLSPSQYAMAKGQVVAPKACLVPSMIDTGTIYVDVPVSKSVTLQNLSALPVSFCWALHGIGDVTSIELRAIPREGWLPPFENMQVELRMNPNIQGSFEYIAYCDIQDMDTSPVGVSISGYISDVCVSYFVSRPLTIRHLESSEACPIYDGKVGWKQTGPRSGSKTSSTDPIDAAILPSSMIPCIDFGRRCHLGTVHSLRFTIRNDTAVTSKVTVHIGKYGARQTEPFLPEEVLVLSYLTGRLVSFPPTAVEFHGGLRGRAKISPIIGTLDELHELYSSSSGWTMLSRRVEQKLRDNLVEEGRGVFILAYPSWEGILEAWGEWNCEVVCCSCLPGFFSDILYCKVGPLDVVQIPIEIEIVGTPLSMRRNAVEPDKLFQVTEHPELSLVWTAMPAGHPPSSKTFLVANFSSHAILVIWETRKAAASRDLVQINMSSQICEDKILHVILDSYLDQTEGTVHVSLDYQPIDEVACVAQEMDHVCKKDHLADDSWLYVLLKFVPDTKVHVELREHMDVEGGAGKVCILLSEASEVADMNCPFRVVPDKQIIPGRGVVRFTVSFFSPQAANYSTMLLGKSKFMEVEADECSEQSEQSSRSSGVLVLAEENDIDAFPLPCQASSTKMDDSLKPRQLEPLQVHAEAILLIPRVVTNVDDKMEFEYAMTGPNDGKVSIVAPLFLTNSYRCSLSFAIALASPFHIIGPMRLGILQSAEHGDSMQILKALKHKSPPDLNFCLKPGWTLQLNVGFEIMEAPVPPKEAQLTSLTGSTWIPGKDSSIIASNAQIPNTHCQNLTQLPGYEVQPPSKTSTQRGQLASQPVSPQGPEEVGLAKSSSADSKPKNARTKKICHEGNLNIKFSENYEQLVPLHGELVYPVVELLTCTLWNAPPAAVTAVAPELPQGDGQENDSPKKVVRKQEIKPRKSSPPRGSSKQAKARPSAKDKQKGTASPEHEILSPDTQAGPQIMTCCAQDGVFELWFGSVPLEASQTLEITVINPTIAHAYWEIAIDGTKEEPFPVVPPPLLVEDIQTIAQEKKRIARPSVHGPYGPWELHQKVGSNPHRPRRRMTAADNFGEGIIPGTRYTMAPEWPLPWGKARKPSTKPAPTTLNIQDNAMDGQSPSLDEQDGQIFHFSIIRGLLEGGVPLAEPNRQTMLVTFAPTEDTMYQETYHLQVYKGTGFKIRFEGIGVQKQEQEPQEGTQTLVEKPKMPASVTTKIPGKVKSKVKEKVTDQ